MRSNLDDAILASPAPADDDAISLDDLPFDFERRRSSVLVSRAGVRTMITKGAPEALLRLCARVEAADGSVAPLDDAIRAKINALFDDKGRQGYRLLAVAWREIAADRDHVAVDDEADLVFAGCVAFLDPPKTSATEAVHRLVRAGVRVKVISGDAAPVVAHLVAALALPAHGVLSGEEIATMTDAALATRWRTPTSSCASRRTRRCGSCARCATAATPSGSSGRHQRPPAIHAADVGVSVDSGTDVARAAADLILLAPDLGVLADGVAEGRRT